ncbi:MAG: hypothetical protein PHR11_06650, partial [Candidatus Omnitrophica bacterium]|nr:hypothetical protein [Candidatus Omnitrophota bacterium]
AKHTLVSLTGIEKAYLLYGFFFFCALASVGMAVARGYVSPWAWAAALLAIPGFKAAAILKHHSREKMKLVQSSQITIAIHNGAGVLLILALFL